MTSKRWIRWPAAVLAVVSLTLGPSLLSAQSISQPAQTTIDESWLSGLIGDPSIYSFDLSSDGKTVAVLAGAGSKVGDRLWLVLLDIASKRVTASQEVGSYVFRGSVEFAPQVLYAADQRHLIVQDLQTVRVFDRESLKALRTISPPSAKGPLVPLFVLGASDKNVLACAFGPEQESKPRFHTTAVQVAIVDISSGQVLGEWSSEDLPQSISPQGDLIAVSSLPPRRGVLPLNVLDIHGQKVVELTGGFSFRMDAGQSGELGRVRGIFLGGHELLLSPDENVDKTGHHSGESVQFVSVSGKQVQVQQKIKPERYGATGDMAVSADRKWAAVVSRYVPAWVFTRDGALPADSVPEVLMLGRQTSLAKDAALPIDKLPGSTNGGLDNRRPRISADGSVIAIAHGRAITILRRNLP